MVETGRPLGNLVIKFGLDGAQFMDALKNIQQAVKQNENAMKTNLKVYDAADMQLDKLAHKYEDTELVLKSLRAEADKLNETYQQQISDGKENTAYHQRLAKQINDNIAKQAMYTKQLKDTKLALDDEQRGTRTLTDQLGLSQRSTQANISAFDAMKKSLQANLAEYTGLGQQIQLRSSILDNEKAKLQQLITLEGQDSSAVQKQRTALDELASAQTQAQVRYDKLAKSVGGASQANLVLRDGLNKIKSNLSTAADKINAVGSSMTVATLGLGAGFVYGAKQSLDFQNKLQTIKSLLQSGGESAKAAGDVVKGMTTQGIQLSNKYGVSVQSIGDAYEMMIRKGDSGTQAMAAVEKMLKASTAAGSDFLETTKTSMNVMEQFFGKAQNSAQTAANTTKVTNAMAYAADHGSAKFLELGYSMNYVGDYAKSVGYSMEDMSAYLEVMSRRGVEGTSAGTGLRGVIASLAKPSKQAAAAMKDIGLQTKDSHGNLLRLSDIIQQLNDKTKGMGTGDRANIISHMFGRTSLPTVTALMTQTNKQLNDFSANIKKAEGQDYAGGVTNRMMQSGLNQLNRFRQEASNLAMTLSTTLMPEVNGLVGDLNGAFTWFSRLPGPVQTTAASIGLITAAVAPASIGTAALLRSFSTLAGGASWLSKMLRGVGDASKVEAAAGLASTVASAGEAATGLAGAGAAAGEAAAGIAGTASSAGVLASALPLLFNPVTGTIAALGALGVGAYYVWNQSQKLADTSTTVADKLAKQHGVLAQQIDDYDKLSINCHLTQSELGKYIDLQSNLKKATSADQVKNLKDQMDQLQKKSGLSNKQLQTMAGLSKDMVKDIPGAATAVTKEGQAFAYTTDKIKKYNQAQADKILQDYQQKYQAALGNEKKLREDINYQQSKQGDVQSKINKWQAISNDLAIHGLTYTQAKYDSIKGINVLLQDGGSQLHQDLGNLYAQNEQIQGAINKDKAQLGIVSQLREKIADFELSQEGINEKGQQGIQVLAGQVEKLQNAKKQLDQNYALHKISVTEYQNGVKSIQDQISHLKGVGQQISNDTGGAYDLNKTLAKDINKHIKFTGDTKSAADAINSSLAKNISKAVSVGVKMPTYSTVKFMQVNDMASKYGHHANGILNASFEHWATVAERGRELIHDPQVGTYLADKPSIVHLSQGSSVLKNADTERLGKSLGLPGFANGVGDYFDSLLGKQNSTITLGLSRLPDAINGLTDALVNIIGNQLTKLISNPNGSGASRWIPTIELAASMSNVNLNSEMLNAILARVTKESGGDPNAVQRIVDINSLQGHPAQGILQYIPRTFQGWMRAGYGNIRGALDQFLAMFDDSNWLKDIQAPGGWGPTGVRRFAYGGQALGPSIVGEAGKSELMRLSDGSLVLSPAQATLINFKGPADILGGDKTEKLLKLLPHYATGTRREWVKGYTRSDGTKVAGYWRTVKVSSTKKAKKSSSSKSKSSKPAKRTVPKKPAINYTKMISDKIGAIIADYRAGKFSAISEQKQLQALEKHSKTTASQRNKITNAMATSRNQYNALAKKFDSLGSKIVSNYRSSKQSQSSEQNELSMISELKRGNKLTESWYTKIYNQMTSAVNLQSLNTSVQSSAQTYLNAVKSAVSTMNGVIDSAKQTVYGTWGLLDAPTSSTSTVTSGSGLVANLKAQDTQLSQFKTAIAKLRSRKVNSALVDELEALGPNSLAEIQNIAGLSNGMLSQYQNLWSQKNSLSYAVGADMSHSAVTTAQIAINQATAAFNASIAADKKKYYQNGFTIAQSTLSGIQKGFEGVGSVLGNTISAIGKNLYNLVNKDLGIKVTKHAVGGFTFGEQLSWLSENNKPEVVLPLTDKTRSVQLINQALSFMGLNSSSSTQKTDQGSLNQLLSAQQDTNTLLATLAQIFVNKQFTLGTPQAASQLEPYITQIQDVAAKRQQRVMGWA